MDEHILNRHLLAMERHGLDAMVAFSKENVAYGAGYTVPSQQIPIRNRQFAVVTTREGQSVMLLSANELDEARDRSQVEDLRTYHELEQDPMEVLTGILREVEVNGGRIGLELDGLGADRWQALDKHMPGANWAPATEAFDEARMVKTPAELDRLRKAAHAATAAQLEAHASLVDGMRESDFARLLIDRSLANGVERVNMAQVAAGERSPFSNPMPTDRVMRRGEVVKVDLFLTEQGYFSDTGRAVVVEEATPRQREVWNRMQETLEEMIALVRPGIRTREIWTAFERSFERHGWKPYIPFLGHGLGLALHEEPFVAAQRDCLIEEGMVFALEPIQMDDSALFHIEDNLIVTADGAENMTAGFARELVVSG